MAGLETGWGLEFILWLQSWRTGLIESFFIPFHYLGSEDFYMIVLPIIYWGIDRHAGRRISIMFLFSVWLNSLFKEWWQRPRPTAVSARITPAVIEESLYGLPSGHTQLTATLYGTVAYELKKRPFTIGVVIFTLLMGFSRMVLSVHFLHDVLVGLLIGMFLLWLYVYVVPRIGAWLDLQSQWMQLALIGASIAVLLLLHPGLVPAVSEYAIATSITPSATLLGAGIGFMLETRTLKFDARGPLIKRLARILLGVAIIFALRLGLKAAFDGLEPAGLFRLIRYSVIGFALAYGWPWLFVKFGLADTEAA